MQLVKQLCVLEMHWDSPQSCQLILGPADPYREEKGTYRISSEVSAGMGITLDPSLISRDIEYTFTHRRLTEQPLPTPEPRQPNEPPLFITYWREASAQGEKTFVLDEVQRRETWSWRPQHGYRPNEPLEHEVHYLLKVTPPCDLDFSPGCSLQVELTAAEYEQCTKLMPGSVFDVTLRLIPKT